MSEKPSLLQIGDISDRMRDRLISSFDVTKLSDADLAADGEKFVAIATTSGVPSAVMGQLPNLRAISSFGVGYDNVPAAEAADRGILVGHTPDVLNDEVADTTIMLWLAVSRKLCQAERWARSGEWEEKGAFELTRSVRNRKVGIVGLGRIGLTIAKMAEAFDATVVYHSRSRKDVDYRYFENLEDMAKEVDVLIVITPGGPETLHLINRAVLEALGPDGILINVARGSVVDEAAVIALLDEGKLGGAGLDVFAEEPTIPEALKKMENVVLLPHVGSATIETRQAMGDLVCDNLEQWLKDGTMLAPVPECRHLNGRSR